MNGQNCSDQILKYAKENQAVFFQALEDLIRLESYTYGDKEDLDKCAGYVKGLFERLGAEVSILPVRHGGSLIKGKIGEKGDAVMLLGHYDTVFPKGSLETDMPIRYEGSSFYGPGAMDMKGGIIAMYYAIQILQALGMFPDKKLLILISGDEEAGSSLSKQIIMDEAKNCKAVFCMEPAPAGKDAGSFKTARFGRGTYKITVCGKSSHAGNNPYDAENPVLELVHLIRVIEELDHEFENATVSVVHLQGGAENLSMIPADVSVGLDLRFENTGVMNEVIKRLYRLSPANPNITYEIGGGIEKPPMEPSVELFAVAQKIGAELGLEVTGHTVSGGSDGNFTSSVAPTLDGMGMTGTGIHNKGERIDCDSVAYRVALLCRMIQEV